MKEDTITFNCASQTKKCYVFFLAQKNLCTKSSFLHTNSYGTKKDFCQGCFYYARPTVVIFEFDFLKSILRFFKIFWEVSFVFQI